MAGGRRLAGYAVLAAAAGAALVGHASGLIGSEPAHSSHVEKAASGSERRLAVLAISGDAQSQRRRVWEMFVQLTQSEAAQRRPAFVSWYGEDEVFGSDSAGQGRRGILGFARASPGGAATEPGLQSADAPVLTYTLYNGAAYDHIRRNRLNRRAELDSLRSTGSPDHSFPADRSVPAFPGDAVVLKTAWWPIAHSGITALPVWDPELNPPRPGGNGYIGWRRVVAVDPLMQSRASASVAIDFAGRSFPATHRVGLEAFYHVEVDARLAERLMRDGRTKKAVLIALGRPLQAGDYLALVAINMATHEIDDWVWAAFWWHDRADEGPFAADRPVELKSEWRNFLMRSAFASEKPAADDGGPHVCFNPWLEGRFPDGGHGGGTVSNCMACHRRASYPSVSFLPVTRGAPDLANDPAYSSGRLRTSFLWAIALHARP